MFAYFARCILRRDFSPYAGTLPTRVDVIVNRLARHLRRDDGLAQVFARVAAEAGATLHETRSLAELEEVARRLAERGADCVVLAGGDGSCMAGTSALARAFGERMPRVAFAPGGTAGTVARNWGYRGPMAAYARRIVLAARAGAGTLTPRPTLRVRDDAGRDAVGFIFGAGLVASFFDAYYARPLQGYAGAAAIVARVFAGSFVGGQLAHRVLAPVAAELSLDGHACVPRSFSLVAASVVKNLGLHMILLHRAAEDPARVHVVASSLGAATLGPQLPLVLAGRPLLGRDHIDALARDIRLRFTAGPGACVLDGEVFHAAEVRVTNGPVLEYLSA